MTCRAVAPLDKRCAACGAVFPCLLGCCWCTEIVLAPDVREHLRVNYDDCLCRACLEQARADVSERSNPAGQQQG